MLVIIIRLRIIIDGLKIDIKLITYEKKLFVFIFGQFNYYIKYTYFK